jgi:hypothetical protein
MIQECRPMLPYCGSRARQEVMCDKHYPDVQQGDWFSLYVGRTKGEVNLSQFQTATELTDADTTLCVH